jgi:hypothetical protein
MTFDDRDRLILDFESGWWTRSEAKAVGIRGLGMSPSAYYRRLADLLDSDEAYAHAPLLVRRLRLRRLERWRDRFEGTAQPLRPRR